jgi:hypothetical protein
MIGTYDGIYLILVINCAKFQVHGCGAMFHRDVLILKYQLGKGK